MASIHPNRSQCADVCRWRALLGRISIPQRGYPCVHLQTAFIRIDRRYGACVILAIDCTAQTAHSADAPHTTLLSKFFRFGKGAATDSRPYTRVWSSSAGLSHECMKKYARATEAIHFVRAHGARSPFIHQMEVAVAVAASMRLTGCASVCVCAFSHCISLNALL